MSDRRGALLVGLLVWLSCAWFGSWEWNPNNSTRLFAAISLVEDGDATIDEFAGLTIDKARFGGHFYLDKAPGMTLMALPAVWLADRASGESAGRHVLSLDDKATTRFLRLRLRLAAASGPALLTAVAAALLYDLALALTGGAGAALVASLCYALGTPIWGWSTTIFGHAAVAALFVIAAWGIWRATPLGALVAGAALGWAVVVEYQAVLTGAALGLWALARWWPARRRLIALAGLAGGAALVPLIAYNEVAFGVPLRFGYSGVVGFEGMNHGLFGLGVPDLLVLNELLFGTYRGLVWLSPAMLAAALGLRRLVRSPATRGIGWACIATVAACFLVNASYVYWDGGNSTGPRLAMPMAGLLALGLAPLWQASDGRRRWLLAGAALLSGAINLIVASADVMAPPPWRFPLYQVVWRQRFVAGDLRTWPSEWLGWSPWTGLALWAAVALPLLGWLVRRAGRISARA